MASFLQKSVFIQHKIYICTCNIDVLNCKHQQ